MPETRKADLLDALIVRQSALARETAPGSDDLLIRARLLQSLDMPALANSDLLRAWQLDPIEPETLAWLCTLAHTEQDTSFAHDRALDLLKNPFATVDQRRAALPALDPTRGPEVIRQTLPATERVTLVLRTGDRTEGRGITPEDLPLPLGGHGTGSSRLNVMDYFLRRPDTGSRRVEFAVNGVETTLCLAAHSAAKAQPVPLHDRATLWIVMPVRDGGSVVSRCLDSLHRAMRKLRGCRLILVDDGSETEDIRNLLEEQARKPGVRLLRNPGPHGFTAAVNHGLAATGRGPVLLLNSDTWVPETTLPRLLAHLKDSEIGTVTPLSNNAGSLSLAGPGQPCALPSPEICQALARIAHMRNGGAAIDVPNANGFCMLISENCRRQVGPLSGSYESGYYEEVDFSLRASALGFRHVAAVDCFVGHVGSVSYGAEKNRLIALNRRRLHANFPHYHDLYRRFVQLDPLSAARSAILAGIERHWQPTPLPERPALTSASAEATMVIPVLTHGPVLIPVEASILPPALRRIRFRRLRPVLRAQLSAHGLRLVPDHSLVLHWDATEQELHLLAGKQIRVSLDCTMVDEDDAADFEKAVLATLSDTPVSEGDENALSMHT